jgi:glutamyl-tRNA reductase
MARAASKSPTTGMPIVVLGISHKTAPPAVRNRHAFPPDRVREALAALRDYAAVREAAVVATCNRLEIYADVTDFEVGVAQLKDFLTTYRSMRVQDFDQYLYTLLGADAVDQLFKVVTGLDSMLLGEVEIVAQVKEAMAIGVESRSVGPHLARLFRTALRVGKRARTETAISRDVVSLSAAAVELAARHRDLRGADALVVGAGRMGSAVARHLHARGVRSLAIANRTEERAAHVARDLRASVHPLSSVSGLLERADLVMSAVGSGTFVAREADLRAAMTARRGRPLLIVDIAVPRDIEPSAESLSGVTMYELADLRQIVEEHLGGRRSAVPDVQSIIDDHVREYLRWYQSRAAVPLIAGLRKRAEQIRLAEIRKLFERYPNIDDAERAAIEATSVSIINRLLHAPTIRLRESIASGAPADAVDASGALTDLSNIEEQIERQFSAALRPPQS